MGRVFALFETRDQAGEAVQRLIDAGFAADTVTAIVPDESRRREDAVDAASSMVGDHQEAAAEGAMIGGTLGVLAGISTIALPVLAPTLLIGAPLGGLIGAAVGGIAGGTPGVVAPDAQTAGYIEGVQRGMSLVSVEAPDERAAQAGELLGAAGAADMHALTERWRASGWSPPGASNEPHDIFGTYWSESSKLGTGGGTLAGAATGAAVGAIGGPLGAIVGGLAGAVAGAAVGAVGDYTGEAAERAREHGGDEQKADDSKRK